MYRQPPIQYKYKIDHDAFNELTPECLYWLGFLAADGYVKTLKDHSNRVKLELQIQDKEHVQKFNDFVGSNKTIELYTRLTKGKEHGVARIEIFSKDLVDKIHSYGIRSPKSEISLDNELLSKSLDFWRGYIDGNGCWAKNSYDDSEKCNFRLTVTSPNEEILNKFLIFAKETVGDFKAGISRKKNVAKVASVYGQKALNLFNILYYDGSISLERKINKVEAMNLCN